MKGGLSRGNKDFAKCREQMVKINDGLRNIRCYTCVVFGGYFAALWKLHVSDEETKDWQMGKTEEMQYILHITGFFLVKLPHYHLFGF